jgi:hypothetical protein
LITLTILGQQYRSFSSSLCSLLHLPLTSSLLGPNILLGNLFSGTLRLRASIYVRPRFTTGKIIVLYILIFIF